jgi:hypothetical protein
MNQEKHPVWGVYNAGGHGTKRNISMKKAVITFALLAGIALNLFSQQYDDEKDFEVAREGNGITITRYIGIKTEVRIPPRIRATALTLRRGLCVKNQG